MLRVFSFPTSRRQLAASSVSNPGIPGEPIFTRCLYFHGEDCLRFWSGSESQRWAQRGGGEVLQQPWGRRNTGSSQADGRLPELRFREAGRQPRFHQFPRTVPIEVGAGGSASRVPLPSATCKREDVLHRENGLRKPNHPTPFAPRAVARNRRLLTAAPRFGETAPADEPEAGAPLSEPRRAAGAAAVLQIPVPKKKNTTIKRGSEVSGACEGREPCRGGRVELNSLN